MPRLSAGLLLYRRRGPALEVLLVHPGGPFWRNRDLGAWSIPKGEAAPGEDLLGVARRELREEIGVEVDGAFLPLSPVRQAGGKLVHAWAVEADVDADAIVSNTFQMEWPPRSGRQQAFPEVDRAAWFDVDEARRRILGGQVALIDELTRRC
jgi:predicted NUDIX family NTP pyrophosphohydrolase